ncbi:hypothetical protein AOQ88_00195 [Candidatus Riesia sp. GBBU]|nr:hypothetical protein AOQ88_00195 [Candidatus Riesia sp. GBBU]
MILIYPEDIKKIFFKKKFNFYLLIGKDFFFLKESLKKITKLARIFEFNETYKFDLDQNINWNKVYNLIQSFHLFSKKQIILLDFFRKNITSKNLNNLIHFQNLYNDNILLIIRSNRQNFIKQNSILFLKIKKNIIYVDCNFPNKNRAFSLIKQEFKRINISLDKKIFNVLYYNFEGNFSEFNQSIKFLKELHKDRIKYNNKIENLLQRSVKFNYYQWINSIFSGDIEKSLCILENIEFKKETIQKVLKIVQRYLILISLLKYCSSKRLNILLKRTVICNLKTRLVEDAKLYLKESDIHLAITIIIRIKKNIETKSKDILKRELEKLSLVICGKYKNSLKKFFYD